MRQDPVSKHEQLKGTVKFLPKVKPKKGKKDNLGELPENNEMVAKISDILETKTFAARYQGALAAASQEVEHMNWK